MAPRRSAGTRLHTAAQTPLLECAVPTDFMREVPLPDIEVSRSGRDVPQDEDEDALGIDGNDRHGVSAAVLDRWKKHKRYDIGIRMAELATMWFVNGWTRSSFPEFMAWANHRLPCSVFGDLNHSKRFAQEFLPSLVAATQTCVAASLHAIVPALGLPSLLSRVLDVVSINGQSLLPVIYIYTRDDGTISWCSSGCPCLEANLEFASTANGVPLNAHGQIFGAHKAPQMVRTVHALEHSYCIDRDDRAVRLVLSVADQAIQGHGSIHFTDHERSVDGLQTDFLPEAICKFHSRWCWGSCRPSF